MTIIVIRAICYIFCGIVFGILIGEEMQRRADEREYEMAFRRWYREHKEIERSKRGECD